ncbi:DUF2272 domain-containing protein [Lysobacter sp. TY2-98]|uniref:DUF2272 domain-containing protein n=1 Tax=Lysobacter sp. TY2-98 TaxID=2290922 RepID=UPI000E1FE446|nr:DUF2272 domain-containing protein [Lysobacter sp. TY2-98]AXK72131.1 DUF2272 domain-containing protein [Lysobacter sp. TY2-98]
MTRPQTMRFALAVIAATLAPRAHAADVCADAAASTSGNTASRIAAIACAEHDLWYAPFIDENGRLANMRISEAEGSRLRDGATPAWQRVAMYWRGSGVQWPSPSLPAGADCNGTGGEVASALCRTFLIDTPWSAVFVSYVMTRAGVPGFQPSARHVDYVRDAFRGGDTAPYRLADPDAEAPATGDLICFSRVSQVFGVQGFRDWLARSSSAPLAMHCDIVVSTANNRARLVGGNVLQGVTMRVLPLNRLGKFWALPHRSIGEPECDPGTPSACNFNRQDWVALLKLNPSANVPATGPLMPGPPTKCCVVCMLPMAPDMKRCPAPATEPTTSPVR